MRWLGFIGLMGLLLLSGVAATAQTEGMSPEAILILEAINDRRRTQNVAYLAPNPILNQIAEGFADDLSARPEGSTADVYLTSDGDNLDTLLQNAGFPAYSDGYVADFVPIRLFNVTSDQLITYILQDALLGDERRISSRRMKQGLVSRLPLFEPPYREIGIAVASNPTTGRYTYVIVMASRPGELPVVITDPDQSQAKRILTETSSPNVVLRVPNENSHREGDLIDGRRYIGLVTSIRVSESDELVDCPTSAFDTANGWQPYSNRPEWTLSAGSGLKTVYVQMCDSRGTTVLSSAQVFYENPNESSVDPTVMGIVQATQTAAVQAATFEPLRPTVEAILTATAEGS